MSNSYKLQAEAWDAAMAAAEQHVRVAQSLQGRGLALLNSIPMTADGRQMDLAAGAGDLAKLIASATSAAERGVRLEAEARQRLIELHQRRPKSI
jgi:hypothetical protein